MLFEYELVYPNIFYIKLKQDVDKGFVKKKKQYEIHS